MYPEIDSLIRQCYQRLGSKQALANQLGVPWDTIWEWENWKSEPTQEQIQQMQELVK